MPVDTTGRRAFLSASISDDRWRVWLASKNERVLAFSMSEVIDKSGPIRSPHFEGHLHQICVDPADRRQGVGMALVQHTVRDLKARGVDRITVNYWNFNTASRTLFEAAGFAPVETKAELL